MAGNTVITHKYVTVRSRYEASFYSTYTENGVHSHINHYSLIPSSELLETSAT